MKTSNRTVIDSLSLNSIKTYILSPRFQLKPLDFLDLDDDELKTIDEEDTFVMVKDQKSNFLINADIHRFLSFLKIPQSKKEIEEAFTDDDWHPFFEQMLKKGVLIDSDLYDRKLQTQIAPNILLEGETLRSFTIKKTFSFRNNVQTCLAKKKHQKVIIKALRLPIHLSLKKRKKALLEFEEEFILLQSLPTNNHIGKLLSFNKKDHFAVLEFIEGTTLDLALKNKPPLFEKEEIIQQLIAAVSFLHQHKIIHGDLHHKNLILSKNNKLTLIDLGLSIAEDKTFSTTKKGGIDWYLPPERISKSAFQVVIKEASYQSDIYQLGILLFFIIFEKFPFNGFTWDEMYDAIQQGLTAVPELNPTNILCKYLPIIKKCLNTSPKNRYRLKNLS